MDPNEKIVTSCDNGGPLTIHIKDGEIVRVRPLVFDDPGSIKSWRIEARGKVFEPPKRTTVAPFALVGRSRVNSPDRILRPLKRRSFNPQGERNIEDRGKSEFVTISWDEALDIVTSEINRVRATYGPSAIYAMRSSHHMWGVFHYRFSLWERFFNFIGHTEEWHNPDSWEGWHWGGPHTWGFAERLGVSPQYELLEDALKHAELIVHWSNDPDSTRGLYGGQESAIWRLWLRDLGIKQIFIDPFCNYTASILGDKWIAPRPGTDAALALGIAHVWIDEGTYDRSYIETRTLGFDDWKRYVMGEEDGVPKTPRWAQEICDVPARTIKALAREWASKTTMLGAFWGGACRQAYGHEWARMMILLQAMQGLGKPGVNIWSGAWGAPQVRDEEFFVPGYTYGGINRVAQKAPENPVKQAIYRLYFPEAVLSPPIQWHSVGFCGESAEQQFEPYTYPVPGHSEIHLVYRYGGSYLGTMTETNRWVRAYRSPKIEFVVAQTPWMEGETQFADVVLPACTSLERNDIAEWANCSGYIPDSHNSTNHRVIVYQKKCLDPLEESKSDYDIFLSLAKRLGFGDDYTEGKNEEEWIEALFHKTAMADHVSFEAFREKGYFVVPHPEHYDKKPQLRAFFEEGAGLGTPSGRIEFASNTLRTHASPEEERPVVPHYLPSWEGHCSDLTRNYPLQLLSPHPRYDFHTHNDAHAIWLAEIPGHRVLKNGRYWWPVRINPGDAAARGIEDLDIVEAFNDRGSVLLIARVTERVRPGVVHAYESSGRYDPEKRGSPGSRDRGGCVNLLTPSRKMSKRAPGMAPNSCLIQIRRWEGEA
jgi:trimethylamine-N-oxide reductase (cytochrome c)